MCLKRIGKAQLQCPGIGKNADNWFVVSDSALYGASASAYRVYSPTDVSSYEREVCTLYTSALCSPSRLSLGAALVRRGFISKDTCECRLICVSIGAPTRLRIKEKSGYYNVPRNL